MAAEDEEFEWRGQAGLGVRACQFRHPLGYRPHHVLQLEPPSAVTSLALHSDWGLLAAGQLMVLSCCHVPWDKYRAVIWNPIQALVVNSQ